MRATVVERPTRSIGWSMTRVLRIAALCVLAVVLFGAALYRLPYYALGPGPARQVEPLIDIEDRRRYASEGSLVMTTVTYSQVTAIQAIFAWRDPAVRVVHEDLIFPPGVDPDTERQRAISQMDTSKITATSVALKALTDYPKDHAPGALIGTTAPGCPAFGELFAGDVITAIDGTPVRSRKGASDALDAIPLDDAIRFTVRAGGETTDVTLTREACIQGDPDPLLGINMVNPFPFPVTIASEDVGGPSAGLMFALGLYDALTAEDLTGGLTIAGTGEIFPSGQVGPIGDIADKVVAADRVGATVFLVPADNVPELEDVETGDMRLITVSSFDQALEELRAMAAGPS